MLPLAGRLATNETSACSTLPSGQRVFTSHCVWTGAVMTAWAKCAISPLANTREIVKGRLVCAAPLVSLIVTELEAASAEALTATRANKNFAISKTCQFFREYRR